MALAMPSGDTDTFRDGLLDRASAGVVHADRDGRIVDVNDYWCRRMGSTRAELLGTRIADITHPDDRAQTHQLFARLVDSGEFYAIEKRYIAAGGEVVSARASVAAVRDADGRITGAIAFLLDIAAGRRLSERQRFLADLVRDISTMSDARAVMRHASAAIGRFLGVQHAHFVECRLAQNTVMIEEDWRRDDVPSLAGTMSLSDFGGLDWWHRFAAGDFGIDDVETHPLTAAHADAYRRIGVRSYATQPLRRNEDGMIVLSVTDDVPRHWHPDDLALLEEVIARTWPQVERARGEAEASRGLSQLAAEADRERRLYTTILSATPDFVYVFGLDHRFTYANRALLKMWGRSWDDAIGKTCLELGYPDWHAAMHDREIEQVIATRASIRGEVPFSGTDGRRIYDYIFVPVIGENGEVEAIAGTTRDVTDRQYSEALIAGQALVLELIAAGAPLSEVTRALCNLIVAQAGTPVATTLSVMSRDGTELVRAASANLADGALAGLERLAVGPAAAGCGTAAFRRAPVAIADIATDPLWADHREATPGHGLRACWSMPIFSSLGAVLGTLAIYHDRDDVVVPAPTRLLDVVSRTAGIAIERARAEDVLHAQSERLRLLWEAAGVLLTTEEPDAMLRGLFSQIAPHFGIDTYFNFMVDETGEALRLESCAGVAEEDVPKLQRLEFGQAICGRVAQHGEAIVASCIQQSTEDMSALVRGMGIRVYACHPLVAEGRLLGTLSFASRTRDAFDDEEVEFLRTVTRYVTVAYERMRLVSELRSSDRKKDEFIALLAHELRNPLAPLRNGLQVLRLASNDAATIAGAREMMDRQLGHMVRLIDDLLDVSRITRNKLALRRAPVPLAEVIGNAVETARPVIEASRHRLVVELPAEPVILDGDLTRLAQVFSNLLTNSAKYSEPGSRIAITADVRGDAVAVRVKDNGIGIPPEALPTIFDMFSQVDRSFERNAGGLGIGLALVRGLVEMHGGTVQAESDGPGLGSTFTVRLPVPRAPLRSPVTEGGEGTTAADGVGRVLVVDDNRDSAGSMMMMLELLGYDVRVAHDGLEAIERAESFRPALILMDVGMPKLDGHEATRRIRAQPWGRDIVIVALTGWGQEKDRQQSREAGCDHHLVKPVDLAVLRKLLAEVVIGSPDTR